MTHLLLHHWRRSATLYAKPGCLTCGGAGASVPLDEATMDDYCDDCILSQLRTEDDFIRLADGYFTVEAADA